MVLTEALASMEDLFAVGTSPCESLLVKLFFVRLPVRLRFERLVAECAGKVLGRRCRFGRAPRTSLLAGR